jgi:hypothetical protein
MDACRSPNRVLQIGTLAIWSATNGMSAQMSTLPHAKLAIGITADCRFVGANFPLGRIYRFVEPSGNARSLRTTAAPKAPVVKLLTLPS